MLRGRECFVSFVKKHGVTNPQNKTDKFSGMASERFKSDTIETHRTSEHNRSALEAEMIVRMSISTKSSWRKKKPKYQSLRKPFQQHIFLMKEYLTNRKFLPLINFITNVIGVAEIEIIL